MTTSAFARLSGRRLCIAPDPLAVARSLAQGGLEHVALLWSAERARSGSCSYVLAAPDGESHALDPTEDDEGERAVGALARAPRWVGVVPYEAQRRLEREAWRPADGREAPMVSRCFWRRYPAVIAIDHDRGEVLAVGQERAARRLAAAAARPAPPSQAVHLEVSQADPAAAHRARVARARELILDGDLYQVNLARRLDVAVAGGTPLDLLARLCSIAPAEYVAAVPLEDGVHALSTSPELLLEARIDPTDPAAWPRFGRLATEPIKGTRPRGADAPSDAALARELDLDEKERAELAMIVDVERNDLASVCLLASVRIAAPPAVITHRTVHHRRARLVGSARRDVGRAQVIEAMVPSGSVTGAPKVRAMEVIAELEAHRRGLYTGGIGYVAHDGSLKLAMAIRTLCVADGAGHYFTGGGIVADSDPDAEVRETGWKAVQLAQGA